MSDWGYVTLAYTLVWGGLAAYSLVLARRVYQANLLERQMTLMAGASDTGEDAACDEDARPAL